MYVGRGRAFQAEGTASSWFNMYSLNNIVTAYLICTKHPGNRHGKMQILGQVDESNILRLKTYSRRKVLPAYRQAPVNPVS